MIDTALAIILDSPLRSTKNRLERIKTTMVINDNIRDVKTTTRY